MQFAQGKNPTCFICFCIGDLSNFAVVKSFRKFGGCAVDNNSFFFWKANFKFFVFNFIWAAMEFFQINIMVGIVGSNKCNAIVISSSNYWLKYFCKTVIYDMLWI